MHFSLADMFTDIVQNACEAGAELVEIEVSAPYGGGGEFRFLVKDNGKGMTDEELKRVIDPFVTDGIKHPHRKVGLGIPFLIQTAEQSGGGWDIQSEKGKGTTVTAWFDTMNVDTPPVGDIPGMFRSVLMLSGPPEMVVRRLWKSDDGTVNDDYEFRKSELIEVLGDLENAGSLVLLKQYLQSLESASEEE